jgi:hypothetical protein
VSRRLNGVCVPLPRFTGKTKIKREKGGERNTQDEGKGNREQGFLFFFFCCSGRESGMNFDCVCGSGFFLPSCSRFARARIAGNRSIKARMGEDVCVMCV